MELIDQTVIQRVLSRKEKLQFEREMLNLLGLPRKPRRLSNLTTESSAPRFLLDIYRSLDKGKVQFTNSEFNVGGEDIRSVKESDSIMTFLSHSKCFDVNYISFYKMLNMLHLSNHFSVNF